MNTNEKKSGSVRRAHTLLVGLTGGIGSGQSTVAEFLEKLGARTINADRVAHRVVNYDNEAKGEIRNAFGRNVYYRNGKLNRKLLARKVFGDQLKTLRLNGIVHPRMVSRIVDEIEKSRESGNCPMIVLDAALIFEANIEKMFDAIIVVTARKQTRIDRVVERDGLGSDEIQERMSRQIPLEAKVKWADHVIQNNSTIERLEERTKQVFTELLRTAEKRPSRRRSGRKRSRPRNQGQRNARPGKGENSRQAASDKKN